MTRDQKIVAAGASSGIVAMLLAMWLLHHLLPAPAGVETLAGRLGYALRWAPLAALPLFAMLAARLAITWSVLHNPTCSS